MKTLETLESEYHFARKNFIRAVNKNENIEKWYDAYCLASETYHQEKSKHLGIGAMTEIRYEK